MVPLDLRDAVTGDGNAQHASEIQSSPPRKRAKRTRIATTTAMYPTATPPTPSAMQAVYNGLSDMYLSNYAVTGDSDWLHMRERAGDMFQARKRRRLPQPRPTPTPTSVSRMIQDNVGHTGDQDWIDISQRLEACFIKPEEIKLEPPPPPICICGGRTPTRSSTPVSTVPQTSVILSPKRSPHPPIYMMQSPVAVPFRDLTNVQGTNVTVDWETQNNFKEEYKEAAIT
jgi:hypothetical protein